jgi:hypothetical protein
MSDAAEPLVPKQDLQFDTVQTVAGGAPGAGVPTCKECSQPIADRYYEVLGVTVCERCRTALAAKFSGSSSTRQLARAALYGTGAAALGAALYYAVREITGLEIGIIAIAVGWLVGRAVQRGGASGGGWKYQALAVGLTYLAIASTYVPLVVKEFGSARPKATAQAGRRPTADSTHADSTAADSTAAGAAASEKPVTFLGFLTALLMVAGLLAALPIVANVFDMPSGLLGLIIIYIGLLQAWRMNKRVELVFSGPFQVGGSQPQAGAA